MRRKVENENVTCNKDNQVCIFCFNLQQVRYSELTKKTVLKTSDTEG